MIPLLALLITEPNALHGAIQPWYGGLDSKQHLKAIALVTPNKSFIFDKWVVI
jgi:hypothetical protein